MQNKGNCSTEAHDGGDLELVKPAHEPISYRPKPCAYLTKLRRNLARSPLLGILALVGRKNTVVRFTLSPETPSGSRL